MKIARRFVLLLVALGILPWAVAPLFTGATYNGEGPLPFDFSGVNLQDVAARLPIVAAFFAGAILLTYALGRLRWAEERASQLDSLFESGDAVVSLKPLSTDSYALIRGTCGKLVQTRGYDAAWIALMDDDGSYRASAEMGDQEGFADLIEQMQAGHWSQCTEKALSQTDPVVFRDTVSQCSGCPLQGRRYGRGSVALRIGAGDRVFGVICVSAPAHVVTSREEHVVLKRIARDLEYALRSVELAGKHRETEENLAWERAVRSAVAESADALSAPSRTVADIGRLVLSHALTLTESREGFAHALDERTGVAVPYLSEGTEDGSAVWGTTENVALTPDGGQYPSSWAGALNDGAPFYRNASSAWSDDDSPDFDPQVEPPAELATSLNDRMLAAPAVANGELVGQIVITNPHRSYTDRDLDAIVRLAEIFAVAVRRARTEQALLIREGTVAAATDPTVVTDTEGIVTYVNDAFSTAWRTGNDTDATGQPARQLCTDAAAFDSFLNQALSEGRAEAELTARRSDGSTFPVAGSARAIRDDSASALRVAVTMADLTEEKLTAETEKVLWRIAESACTVRDLGLLFRKARQELDRVMSTRNFFVALYDEDSNTISLPLFLDERDQNQFDTVPAGKTLTAYVVRTNMPVRLTRREIDDLVHTGAVETVGTPCEIWMGAPMMSEDRVIGVVAAQSYTNGGEFSQRDLDTLTHAAAEMAPAVARRRTEMALREEQGRFYAVSETVSAALINTDSHGKILSWNRAAELMFGYTSEEAVGQPFSLVVPEGFLQAHVDGLMRAVSSDSQGYVRASVEGIGRRKDKSEFPMALSIGAWKNDEETFFTAIMTDITERKQVSEELQFLSSIPLQVSDALIVTDLNYRITYVNKAAEFLFGYAGEEIIGRTLDVLSAETWENQLEDEIHRTVSAGRIWTGQIKSRRKRGGSFLVEFRVSPLRDSSGKLSSYISICHDLTERMRSEQLLRTLNAASLGMEISLTPDSIFAAVTEEIRQIGSSCALLLMKGDGKEISTSNVSPGFAGGRTTGRDGWSWEQAPDLAIDAFGPLAKTIRDHRSSFLDNTDSTDADRAPDFAAQPETWLPWALSCRPTILAPLITGEDVTGVLAVQSSDLATSDVPAITAFANQLAAAWKRATLMEELSGSLRELRRTQDILLRAQKMEAVGNLAGGVAHDFNNLLTAITGYAELALAGMGPDDPALADLHQIRKVAAQAASLTSQLLAFSRQTPLQPKIITVNEVVENLDKMMRRLIGEDVELRTELAPGLDHIKADPTQMQQVVMNLILNGRDAMPGGGSLVLETRNVTFTESDCESVSEATPGDFVRLSVTDTGTGIDPDVVDRIFEPFFTTKELGKGTGLGLSVVYGVVSQHGGWISIESTLGEGTTFTVYLPSTTDEPTDDLSVATSATETSGHGEKILVVEDEQSVREFALRALRESGYTVLEASDADEALEVFRQQDENVDLVFSDVVLPTRSGVELVEELQTSRPDIRVLFASGYTDTKSQWEAIRSRGFGFLQKPYGVNDLLRTIREAMETS